MTLDELLASISPASKGATNERIAAFENLIGYRLPDDYKALLTATGGGRVGPSVTLFDGSGDQLGVIGGLGQDNDFSIEADFLKPAYHPIPEGLLWIMTDGGGNGIMLCLRDDDRHGSVYFVDHEAVAYQGNPDPLEVALENGLLTELSPSFSGFVAGLVCT